MACAEVDWLVSSVRLSSGQATEVPSSSGLVASVGEGDIDVIDLEVDLYGTVSLLRRLFDVFGVMTESSALRFPVMILDDRISASGSTAAGLGVYSASGFSIDTS